MESNQDVYPLPQFEHLQKVGSSILSLPVFEGGMFDIAKQVSSNNIIRSSFVLGSQQGSEYTFGFDHIKSNHALISRIGGTGNGQIQFHKVFTPNLKAKVLGQLGKESVLVGDVEYADETKSFLLRGGTKNIMGVSCAYKYSDVVVGGEAVHVKPLSTVKLDWKGVTPSQINVSGLVQKDTDDYTMTGKITASKFGSTERTWNGEAQYLQKVSKKVSVAADFKYNVNRQEASSAIGYEYNLTKAKISANLNNQGTLQALYEEKISPAFKFVFSCQMNHWYNQYKFGYGINIG